MFNNLWAGYWIREEEREKGSEGTWEKQLSFDIVFQGNNKDIWAPTSVKLLNSSHQCVRLQFISTSGENNSMNSASLNIFSFYIDSLFKFILFYNVIAKLKMFFKYGLLL